jgi:hypothetical protein
METQTPISHAFDFHWIWELGTIEYAGSFYADYVIFTES